jgi:hypothetical protein
MRRTVKTGRDVVAALLGAEEFGFIPHPSSVRLYYDESMSFKHVQLVLLLKIRVEKNFKEPRTH